MSDDVFSSKQLLPGYANKASSKPWIRRGTVTKESMLLCSKRAINEHEELPSVARRPMTKAAMEALSEKAAVVCALSKEVLEMVPIKEATFKAQFSRSMNASLRKTRCQGFGD